MGDNNPSNTAQQLISNSAGNTTEAATALSSGAMSSRTATLADFGIAPKVAQAYASHTESIARRNGNFGNHRARYGNDRNIQNFR